MLKNNQRLGTCPVLAKMCQLGSKGFKKVWLKKCRSDRLHSVVDCVLNTSAGICTHLHLLYFSSMFSYAFYAQKAWVCLLIKKKKKAGMNCSCTSFPSPEWRPWSYMHYNYEISGKRSSNKLGFVYQYWDLTHSRAYVGERGARREKERNKKNHCSSVKSVGIISKKHSSIKENQCWR